MLPGARTRRPRAFVPTLRKRRKERKSGNNGGLANVCETVRVNEDGFSAFFSFSSAFTTAAAAHAERAGLS